LVLGCLRQRGDLLHVNQKAPVEAVGL
jgi:hypothetical protein